MARWGFVSDALIRAYNRTASSAPISGPFSNVKVQEHIQCFVDDSHGIIIQEQNDKTPINETICRNLQEWEALLNAVGGQLEISKCKIAKFKWKMNQTGEMLMQPDDNNTPITISDHETNNQIQLSEIQPSFPYKLLGVNIAIDGNNQEQSRAMNIKCGKLANAFARCNLSTTDTKQGYQSIYLPSVTYGLAAKTIPNTSLQEAQRQITHTILPKMGYNRHTPIPIVYAPTHFGGIGLNDLYVEQGLAKIKFFVHHIRTQSDITNTLTILLESYMMIAGSTCSPFEDLTPHPYVKAPWIKSLQTFLHHIDMTITTPTIQRPQSI
jgi:hypothetical protein